MTLIIPTLDMKTQQITFAPSTVRKVSDDMAYGAGYRSD